MEHEEVRGLVWEELARAKTSLSAKQLSVACGVDLAAIMAAIARLRQTRLAEVATPLPDTTYLPILKLDAIRWAQALELGIPLTVLERYAKLSSGSKNDALRVATDGTVDKETQRHIQEKQEARLRLIEGRAATKVAASDLAKIEEDAAKAILALKDTKLDPAAEIVLRYVKEQASLAVDSLRRRLIDGGR